MKCPLCGTVIAGAWSAARTDTPTVMRDRIATLTRRIDELEQGDLTPRHIKDETLWLCADCQRLMTDQAALDRQEIQRRIRDHIRQLEARLARRRRAS
jgi:ribosomal protein L37AE/L43A